MLFAFSLSALSLLSLKWLVPGVHFVRVSTTPSSFLAAVIVLFLLSACEEIGFRGYPLRRLLPVFGIWPTFLIVALVFAGYHLVMGWGLPQALFGTTAGSVLFSMAAVAARRGLAFPIGVHAGWNLATWSLNTGDGFWQMTFAPGLTQRVQTTGMVSYLVCMLLGIVLLWSWNRRPGSTTRP
jgi:membrane protease YdiL (CAAX protease family)